MSNALYRRLLNVNNVGPGAAYNTSVTLTDVSAVGARWGTNSASNTLTVQMFTVENLA